MAKTANNPLDRFPRVSSVPRNRIIGASFGEVGTGKTHFWLGAPGPIVVQSFDQGLEGVAESIIAETGKEIRVIEYEWSPAAGAVLDQNEAVILRDKFIADYEYVIQHARTVVWDKESDVWGLFKYAEFGFGEKGVPNDWDSLKQRLRRLINMPKALEINFGLIQGMKNEWISQMNHNTGKKGITQSGNRVRSGMDDVDALVHINLHHERTDGEFVINVGKARGPGGHAMQDQTYTGLSFVEFATLAFPDSAETDWL